MTDVDGVAQIQMLDHRRDVGGIVVHVVPIAHLGRPPMPAAVMRDDAKALLQEVEHLGVPVVAGKRPTVMEHDGLTGTPVLVVNLGAVLRGDRAHVSVCAWMERISGGRSDSGSEKGGDA